MIEATDVKKKLVDALRLFDTLMVATRAENGAIHARPMFVAEVTDDGELWFATPEDPDELAALSGDDRGVVTAQGGGVYVSLSGRLDVIHDADRVTATWKSSWVPWFVEEDPRIVLLRLRPEVGEYWDQTCVDGMRFVFEAARAKAPM